jgi:hypothetical protein
MVPVGLFRSVLIGCAVCLCASSTFSQSVVLWRNQSAPRGTWREETRIEASGMTLKVGSAERSIDGTGTFAFMESVQREFSNPNKQDARLLNSSTQGSLAFLGNAAQDFAQGSVLLGKKMVGKREQEKWKFAFKDVKPSLEEQKALDGFGGRSDLLAFWPYLYGAQPRRKGETWKADTAALSKDAKVPLTIELTFTLTDIADHHGERCANVAVTGFVKAPFGANNASSLKLDVQGNIWRELRELVDVEANLRGTFTLARLPANNPNVPAGTTSEISAPFTMVRTVMQEKR